MKNQFRDTFSRLEKVNYWDSVYDQQDFYGDCLRLRMDKALLWLDDLHLNSCARVLDAGCGAGRQLYEAVKKGYNTVGMDFSNPMLVSALNKLRSDDQMNGALCQGDLERLPFHDSSFEAVICLGVITYLPSEKIALSELARVLKPGGTLIISIINKARLVRFFDLPLVVQEMFQKYFGNINGSQGVRAELLHSSKLKSYFISVMVKSLEQAGFLVNEYETIPMEIPTLFGKRIFSPNTARKIAFLFEQNSKIPFVKSFGGMCVFRAKKESNM